MIRTTTISPIWHPKLSLSPSPTPSITTQQQQLSRFDWWFLEDGIIPWFQWQRSQSKTENLVDPLRCLVCCTRMLYEGLHFWKPTDVQEKPISPPAAHHTNILQDQLWRWKTQTSFSYFHIGYLGIIAQCRPCRTKPPSFSLSVRLLFLAHIGGAMYSNIDDCDEGRSSLSIKDDFLLFFLKKKIKFS